jgi:hypothetical protein
MEEWYTDLASVVESWATAVGVVAGGIWVLFKFGIGRESFPRIRFDVDVNFIGLHGDNWIVEILGVMENKGLVPHGINDLTFNLRSLSRSDALTTGDDAIGGQVEFPNVVARGSWIPTQSGAPMEIHPGVTLRYNHVNRVPVSAGFVLVHGVLDYGKGGLQHRADRVVKVPANGYDADHRSDSPSKVSGP